MSVIVKGMEMPKNCDECRFCVNGFTDDAPMYECVVQSYENVSVLVESGGKPFDFRPDWCPLIEIPTPHGRLIDADKFAETLKEVSIRQGYDKLFSDNILSVGDVFDAIAADLKGEGLDKYKLAPTVIEAEGEI